MARVLNPRNAPPPGAGERLRPWAVPLTVCLLAALYLLFILSYSVDVPRADDGLTVLLIHSALHGNFQWQSLFSQHIESRVFVPNLIFLSIGYLDHFDLRTVMILSAILLIAGFLLLLRLCRVYLGRPLTVLPVLLLGLVWFSLIDVVNALWAFQIGWYLVLFCLIAIAYLLLVSRWPRYLNLALAIVAAMVATFSALQGVIAWPEGVLLLLWATPWVRRTIVEVGCWLLTCALSRDPVSARVQPTRRDRSLSTVTQLHTWVFLGASGWPGEIHVGARRIKLQDLSASVDIQLRVHWCDFDRPRLGRRRSNIPRMAITGRSDTSPGDPDRLGLDVRCIDRTRPAWFWRWHLGRIRHAADLVADRIDHLRRYRDCHLVTEAALFPPWPCSVTRSCRSSSSHRLRPLWTMASTKAM